MSFVVATIATPFVRAWALRKGVVDEPGGRRVHLQVTPRLGGVALFIGFFAPLAGAALWGSDAMRRFLDNPDHVIGLVLGSIVVAAVGAVDDMRGLGAWRKLLAQAVAATIAYAAGFRIDAVQIPEVGSLEMGVFAFPITLFWFLGIINALNLIDGLDGLAAGIAFFASLANFVIAYLNDAFVVALLSASLAGSLLGFLRYNFNPAKIFMGDSGSMFLGFVLAATSLRSATTKSSTAVAILAPMVALGVPIFDTMLAMIRRTVARQSIFSADRGHIHHRLLDMGLTHRRVVLVLYVSSILLALAALGIAFGRSWQFGAALVLAGAVLFTLVRAAGAAQRALKPLTTSAERATVLQLLSKRVEAAVAALEAAVDETSVDAALMALGSDRRLLSHVRLRSSGLADSLGLATAAAPELLFAVTLGSESPHALEVTLHPRLLPITEEARPLFANVADACGNALDRIATRKSRPHLLVAQ